MWTQGILTAKGLPLRCLPQTLRFSTNSNVNILPVLRYLLCLTPLNMAMMELSDKMRKPS
jgi:hypothetical protein